MQDGFLRLALTKPWNLHWPGLPQRCQLDCRGGGGIKLPETGRNTEEKGLWHTATRGHKKQS